MKNAFLAITLVLALFVFGCTQPSAPSEGTPAPSAPVAPSGEAGETQEPAQPQPEPEPEPEPTLDIGTMTCFALMGSGTPVECTMTSSYQGQSSTVKFFMRGEDRMRSEMDNPSSPDCTTMVVIMKDDVSYMGCEGQKWMGTTCDWLMTVPEAAEAEPGEPDYTGASASFDYSGMEDMPTSVCSCKAWSYDESKFETPGKVCDDEEFMDEFMADFDMGDYE